MQWRNPAYNAAGTIDCEILHPIYGWIPFTADPNDTGAEFDVAAMVNIIVASGSAAPYVPPPGPTEEELRAAAVMAATAERDQLLAASDYTQLLDFTGNRQDWAIYRQALRDLPNQPGFPYEIVWPEQPPIAMS